MSLNIKTAVTPENPTGYIRVAGNASNVTTASNVIYTNTTSELSAGTVQAAIDEIATNTVNGHKLHSTVVLGGNDITVTTEDTYQKDTTNKDITTLTTLEGAVAQLDYRTSNVESTTLDKTGSKLPTEKVVADYVDGEITVKTIKVNDTALTPGTDKDVDITITTSSEKNGVVIVNGVDKTVYTHPSVNHIPADGAAGNTLRWDSAGKAKWEAVDTTPTNNSTGLVTSGGVKTALDNKANKTSVSTDSTAVSVKTVPETLGYAGVKVIGGKTQKVVQLAVIYYASGETQGVVRELIGTNGIKFSGTCTKTDNYTFCNTASKSIIGHVYFCTYSGSMPSGCKILGTIDNGVGAIKTATATNFSISMTIPNETTLNNTIYPMIIDLTAMYGAGKEPTLEQCREIFADYVPYTEGTLWNAPVERIVSTSKNIFDKNLMSDVSTDFKSILLHVKKNTNYIMSVDTYCPYAIVYFADEDTNASTSINGLNPDTPRIANSGSNGIVKIIYRTVNSVADSPMDEKFHYQIEEGTTATTYSPYFETELSLPNCVKNLPDYGVGISADCTNYVDFETGKYYHNVTSINLDSIWWTYASGYDMMYASNPGMKIPLITDTDSNTISSKYDTGLPPEYGGATKYSFYIHNSNSWVCIRGFGISDTTTFKNETMKDIVFVYRLATPEIIDISDIIRPIPCETGGTITLVNEHSLDVPNTIVYKKEV